MKNTQTIPNSQFLKFILLVLLMPLYSLSFGQAVSNGGGKVSVDISVGDPGGPWIPGPVEAKICLQIGTCDTIYLSEFSANYLAFMGTDGIAHAGVSYRVLGYQDGDYLIEVCIESSAKAGLVVLTFSNSSFEVGGEAILDETIYWRVLGCISYSCPDCVYENPNNPAH